MRECQKYFCLSLPYFLNIPTLLSSRKLELRFRNLSSILNNSTEEVLPGSTDKAKPLYISTTIVREKFVKKFVKTLKVGLYMQIYLPRNFLQMISEQSHKQIGFHIYQKLFIGGYDENLGGDTKSKKKQNTSFLFQTFSHNSPLHTCTAH